MTRNDTAKREHIGEGPRAKDGCPCCTRDTRADEKRARRAAQARAMREAIEYIDEIVVDTGGIGSIAAEGLREAGFNVRAKVKRRAS